MTVPLALRQDRLVVGELPGDQCRDQFEVVAEAEKHLVAVGRHDHLYRALARHHLAQFAQRPRRDQHVADAGRPRRPLLQRCRAYRQPEAIGGGKRQPPVRVPAPTRR